MPLEPIRIGTTFQRRYLFESSPGVPLPLTGITITWLLENGETQHLFGSGDGVTVTPLTGTIDVDLTPEQTEAFEENNGALSYLNFLGPDPSTAVEAKAQQVERIVPKEAHD
jgi:hypothetical protein